MPSTTAAQAPASVADLHRADRLVTDYPQVRGLLAEADTADAADLARAGRLLARLDPDEVIAAHPGVRAVRVAVTGHGTLGALTPLLTAELARHGLLARTYAAGYDSYVFELGDEESGLYAADPELALCVLDAELVFADLPSPWRPEDVAAALTARLALLEDLADRFVARCSGVLVLNTLPLPARHARQLVDHRSRAELGALWREANARLLRLTERSPSLVVVDLDPLLAEGVPACDPRMSLYARAHLSDELLAEYARTVGHLAAHLAGRTRKVLAVDLDGTLWSGVLGEDGPDGVEVGSGPRGEVFAAFQRTIRQLTAQGVLLTAVSKNDLELVQTVLREHPGMVLREDDFVRVVANWRPKHDNLRELASVLNVGVDGFVFVDDSPYECGLVRHALPDVAVVAVDGEPGHHIGRLLRDGWFDTLRLTDEDRARVARYHDEVARKDFLDSFDSLEAYLASLGVRVRLAAMTEADVARVAQLTLRTNQFNLTTVRLQPARVRALLDDPGALVVTVSSGDRFGENGLVGAVFVRFDGDTARIENFLLSCRVFARGIEQASLSAVLRHARDRGAREVRAFHRPTARNGMVEDFYPRYGFARSGPDGELAAFTHDLSGIVPVPDTVDLTDTLGGTA